MKQSLPTNPYETPKQESKGYSEYRDSVVSLRAILFVSASAAVCGLIGVGLGAGIGRVMPAYYRSVFAGGDSPSFDPVAVGMGQGLTQGIVAGLFVGLGLVAIQTWYRLRTRQ